MTYESGRRSRQAGRVAASMTYKSGSDGAVKQYWNPILKHHIRRPNRQPVCDQ